LDGKKLVSRISTAVASTSLYLPILAGIITPMLYLLPAWYTAWYVIGFIFPFSDTWGGLWLPYFESPPNPIVPLGVGIAEIALLIIGVCLFLWGLKEIVTRRVAEDALVTTGPYKWVRHPQHLGIILLTLPTALFNPGTNYWSGIRPGDLLSWSLISFLLLIVAEWEEGNLHEKFEDEFALYTSKTPFIIPGIHSFPLTQIHRRLARRGLTRYLFLFAIYWILMVFVLYGFTFVQLYWSL
jgi:protein-S-isoprenylcysteine O-methyltransferase Ste14